MLLLKDNFVAMLNECPKGLDSKAVVEEVVSKAQPEEREEAERIFYLLVRIMMAKNTQELADVSVQDILTCFKWQHIFEEIFMAEKAGGYFSIFQRNMNNVRTVRKVRVL